jgi:hypothetical protein
MRHRLKAFKIVLFEYYHELEAKRNFRSCTKAVTGPFLRITKLIQTY